MITIRQSEFIGLFLNFIGLVKETLKEFLCNLFETIDSISKQLSLMYSTSKFHLHHCVYYLC